MLKLGTFGFIPLAVPVFPGEAMDPAVRRTILVLAVIGITYGAIVAAMQPNLKRIIAYSSVAHMGFVTMGIFAVTTQGVAGGIFQMVSHGIVSGALFLALLAGCMLLGRCTRAVADNANCNTYCVGQTCYIEPPYPPTQPQPLRVHEEAQGVARR